MKFNKLLALGASFAFALFAHLAVLVAPQGAPGVTIEAVKSAEAQMVIDFYRRSSHGLTNSVQNIAVTISSGNTSGTATLTTAVNTATTSLDWSGLTDGNTGTWNAQTDQAAVTLTNPTTVTATRAASGSFALTVYVSVVDWNSAKVKTVQYGSATPGSASTTATYTLPTSVTTTNAVTLFNGYTASGSTSTVQVVDSNASLTNANTVTVHRDTANTITPTTYFCVLEFQSGVLNSGTQQVVNSFTGTSTTSTITSITTSQAAMFWGGSTNTTAGSNHSFNTKAVLTNGTTISFTKVAGTGATEDVVTVAEFKSTDINSVNRNTNTIATSSSSQASTITAVNTAKTIVHQDGQTTNTSSSIGADFDTGTTQTNATTITTARVSSSASISDIAAWEAIEFK